MPSTHNHNDRGALHDNCPACRVVAHMMSGAGIDPAQVSDYRQQTSTEVTPPRLQTLEEFFSTFAKPIHHTQAFRSNPDTPGRYDRVQVSWSDSPSDTVHEIHGQEMGNKASIDADRSYNAEIDWLTELLARIEAHSIGYGQAALYSHLYRDHDLLRAPLDVPLRSLQEIHAGSHLLHQGHGGDSEHMISRIDRESLRGRKRLLEQKRWSALNTGLKAEQHRRRERAARESREQVLIDSARALIRATEHAKGTVMSRVTFEGASTMVAVQVGYRDRVTVASATIGTDTAIGTAVCHPTDRFDKDLGRQLATARALIALGAHYEAECTVKVQERNA